MTRPLTDPDRLLLDALRRTGMPMRPVDLAERLDIDRRCASRALQRLTRLRITRRAEMQAWQRWPRYEINPKTEGERA